MMALSVFDMHLYYVYVAHMYYTCIYVYIGLTRIKV